MRILLFIFLLCFISCETETPKNEVQEQLEIPQIVLDAFAQKYPNEKNADWEVDRNNNYEAQFKEDGVKYKADFSPNGIWVETECSLKKKDLPDAVRETIKRDYDDHKIVEIEKTDHPKKGIFYDIEFKKDGKKFDIEYDENGVFVGRED